MEATIINILRQYKENTSLSEGHYDYLIPGDEQTLQDIARQIVNELNEDFPQKS